MREIGDEQHVLRKVRIAEVGDALRERRELIVILRQGALREAGTKVFHLLRRADDEYLIPLPVKFLHIPDIGIADEPVLQDKRLFVRIQKRQIERTAAGSESSQYQHRAQGRARSLQKYTHFPPHAKKTLCKNKTGIRPVLLTFRS